MLNSGTGEGMSIQPSVLCAGFKFHHGSGAGGIGYIPEQSPTLIADWHNHAVLIGGEPCEATRSACGGGAPEEARGL